MPTLRPFRTPCSNRRRRAAMAIAIAAILAVAPAQAAPIVLSAERGGQIGVLCRIFDPDGASATAGMDALCAEAGDVVEQGLAGGRQSVVRFGIQPDTPPEIDGPTVLIAMETRPPWAGGEHPRVLLRALVVRDGVIAPSVGLPPFPVDLGGAGWEDRARHTLRRMIGFVLR